MRQVKVRIKLISLLLVVLLGAIVFAGCSADSLQDSSGQALPASSASTAATTTTGGASAESASVNNNSVVSSPVSSNPQSTSNPVASTTTSSSSSQTTSPAIGQDSPAPTPTLSSVPSTTNPAATPVETNPASQANNQPTPNGPAENTTPAIQSFQADGVQENNAQGGGGKNIVQLLNKQNGRMDIRGSIQLNKIKGPNVQPVNLAAAQGSCTDCQTYAVALQINLISREASNISPQNAAVAVNIGCLRCQTYAQALQYTFQVDDPTQVPPRIDELMKDMDKEINSLKTQNGVTFDEAKTRIGAVITDFKDLAANLNERTQQSTKDDDPNVTPLPTGTAETSPSNNSTVSQTPGSTTPTPVQTVNPTASTPAATISQTVSTSATTPASGGTTTVPTTVATSPASGGETNPALSTMILSDFKLVIT